MLEIGVQHRESRIVWFPLGLGGIDIVNDPLHIVQILHPKFRLISFLPGMRPINREVVKVYSIGGVLQK